MQRFEEALAEFDVLAADPWPDEVDVRIYRGATYRRLGLWEDALRDWERALERDPANGFIAYSIGQSYSLMRRHDEAERYESMARTLEPELPVHWWGLVFARMARGDLEAAASAVDSARSYLGEEGLESGGWWAFWQVPSGRVSEVLTLYQEQYREPGSID